MQQQPVHWTESDSLPKSAQSVKSNDAQVSTDSSNGDDSLMHSDPYASAQFMYHQMARVPSSFPSTTFHPSLQPSPTEFEPHRSYAFHSFEPYSPNRFSFDKKKRRRLAVEETRLLSQVFEVNPKPSVGVRDSLAHRLNMTPRAVQIWFQNRRAKLKRDLNDSSSNLSFCPHASALGNESSESQPDYHPYMEERIFPNEYQFMEERPSPLFSVRSYSDSHLPGFFSEGQTQTQTQTQTQPQPPPSSSSSSLNPTYPIFSDNPSFHMSPFDVYSNMPKMPLLSPQPAATASFPMQTMLPMEGAGGSKMLEPMMATYPPDAFGRGGDSALEPSPDFSYQYQYFKDSHPTVSYPSETNFEEYSPVYRKP